MKNNIFRLRSRQEGFTLLEILLVVAAIAILAGIVIVAINPGKQLGDTRNAQRHSDVNTILNAVYQYSIDNNGNIPIGITGSSTAEVCTNSSSTICTDAGLVDLSVLLTNEKYLVGIPSDPSGCLTTNSSCYRISTTTAGRVTVSAYKAEQGVTISASK